MDCEIILPVCPYCQVEMMRLIVMDQDDHGKPYTISGWRCACEYVDDLDMRLVEEEGGEA